MESPLDLRPKATHKWPPREARWLKSDAIRSFRQSYRNYRKGHWKGAKGEIFRVPSNLEKQAEVSEDVLWNENENNQIKEISIFQDTEDPKVIRQLQQLEQYRSAYRQFRTGESKGAEGELSKYAKSLSSEHLRLLPVAALARCLADQIRTETEIESPFPRFHVHLGAGKLGLGLVIPALVESKCPFAILQRPSEMWESIVKSQDSFVKIVINEDVLVDLYVIRCLEDLNRCPLKKYLTEKKPVEYQEEPPKFEEPNNILGMIVFDVTLDETLLRSADAISCSLGPGLRATLKKLPGCLPPHSGLYRPALYACENDHQAVESVRSMIEEFLYVRPCMVDRICSERVIHEDKIRITTEPYAGEIIVTANFREAIKPAFAGINVRLPRTAGEYSYLYNRKFLLVNGTHTTLAFMSLREFCTNPSDAPGDYELLNAKTMDDDKRRELTAWAVARCLVLLHSHEVTVIKHVHQVEKNEQVIETLWGYAIKTINRFSTVKDSTKRVLGGGVANRYSTRLKAVYDTLQTFQQIPLKSKMIKIAGFSSMKELISCLAQLLKDTEKFVSLGMNGSEEKKSSRIVLEHFQQFK